MIHFSSVEESVFLSFRLTSKLCSTQVSSTFNQRLEIVSYLNNVVHLGLLYDVIALVISEISLKFVFYFLFFAVANIVCLKSSVGLVFLVEDSINLQFVFAVTSIRYIS